MAQAEDAPATSGSRTVVVDLEAITLLDMSDCTAMLAGHKARAGRGLDRGGLLRPGRQPERTSLRMSLGTVLRRIQSVDDF